MKVYSNETEQSLYSPDTLGARIWGYESGAGESKALNGDSLLINLKQKNFAVADSPDWIHWKSRAFLDEFNQMVEATILATPDLLLDNNHCEEAKQIIAENTNKLIRETTRLETTTFTALFIIGQKENSVGMMLHCGDSCLFKIDLKNNEVLQLSRPDICFVGQAQKLSQVEITNVDENTRFLLCSDGLMVLLRNKNYSSLEELLLESLQNSSIDQIPENLLSHYGKGIDLNDDITVVSIDPNKFAGEGNTFLYGSAR